MYQIPGDFLTTYDPGATEQHSDSSDFESDVSPNVSRIIGKHSLLDKKLKTKTKSFKYYINQQVFNRHNNIENDTKHDIDTRESLWQVETVHSSKIFNRNKKERRKRAKSKDLNCGDQVEVGQSNGSIIRHKVIPCISSIFRRYSNNVKHNMSVIKENLPENITKDNSCQARRGRRGMKKYNREQCYAIQPIYAVSGMTHGELAPNPCQQTKMTKVQINQQSRNQYSNTSLSLSSSEVGIEEKKLDHDARRKFKKRLITEIKNEYLRHGFNKHVTRNQEQQCPSKLSNKDPYQVFNTPYQKQNKGCPSADSDSVGIMPSSSRFWDFICDKISKKYHIPRNEAHKPCTCTNNQPPQNPNTCVPANCKHYQATGPSKNSNENSTPTSTTPGPNITSIEGEISVFKLQAPPVTRKKATSKNKTECQCFSTNKKKSPRDSADLKTDQADMNRSCQEPHDPITDALAQKYNGKVLCIHNPPCILINGCLNLSNPQEQNEDEVSVYPVVEEKHSYTPKKNKCCQQYNYMEQSSQYAAPLLEMVQCQTSENKAEKLIQSMCSHNPPCEVVRGCYKQKYEPMQLDSCSHLPISDKLLDEQKYDKISEHSTQCADITEFKEKTIVLTARGNISTQVKPKIKMVCRHKPPCIMIPNCLVRVVYDSYMTIEAIPDCVHQPQCELIPACCRKPTKGMVSVSSQYPNGCRVV